MVSARSVPQPNQKARARLRDWFNADPSWKLVQEPSTTRSRRRSKEPVSRSLSEKADASMLDVSKNYAAEAGKKSRE